MLEPNTGDSFRKLLMRAAGCGVAGGLGMFIMFLGACGRRACVCTACTARACAQGGARAHSAAAALGRPLGGGWAVVSGRCGRRERAACPCCTATGVGGARFQTRRSSVLLPPCAAVGTDPYQYTSFGKVLAPWTVPAVAIISEPGRPAGWRLFLAGRPPAS